MEMDVLNLKSILKGKFWVVHIAYIYAICCVLLNHRWKSSFLEAASLYQQGCVLLTEICMPREEGLSSVA